MKTIIATSVFVLALGGGGAWADQSARVPTGYEVPGATNYILVEGRVVQIRDVRGTKHSKLFWKLQDRSGGNGGFDSNSANK